MDDCFGLAIRPSLWLVVRQLIAEGGFICLRM